MTPKKMVMVSRRSIAVLSALAMLGVIAAAISAVPATSPTDEIMPVDDATSADVIISTGTTPTSTTELKQYPELGITVETVSDGLSIPWSIGWACDTMLVTERDGRLRAIQDGRLVLEPLLQLEATKSKGEGGMLGLAVDPNFGSGRDTNRYIYIYHTYEDAGTSAILNKVVRYHLAEDKTTLTEDMILVDMIPGASYHDGGRIKFGPDQMLYITTGDAGNPYLAQDPSSLAGKILRINPDGTIPSDNPIKNSPVYSMGHRNPQGMDWDMAGNLFVTEHGPSGWRGTAHDEINLVIPGANYGWPDIIGDESMDGLLSPILHTGSDTWAPSGATFYHADMISQWTGKYFVATLRGTHLHMIDFDPQEGQAISHTKMFQDEFGRLRDVATGPDGLLYILTSNMDGRAGSGETFWPSHQDGGDKILRIYPTGADAVYTTNPHVQPDGCPTAPTNSETR